MVPYSADVNNIKDRSVGYLDADSFEFLSPTTVTSGRPVTIRSDAWKHLWRHWDDRGVHGSPKFGGTSVDMLFVRCFEEQDFQRNLLTNLNNHHHDLFTYAAVFPIK